MPDFLSFFCFNRASLSKKSVFFTAILILLSIFGILLFIWPLPSNMLLNNNQFWPTKRKLIQASNSNYVNCNSSTINWDMLLSSNTLTADQLLEYFLWTNHSSCQLSHDFGGVMLKNPSGLAGQKAVCIDPEVAPEPGKCLVYSFGISNDWSFDEKMAEYGCEVFSFDPSIGLDQHDHIPGNVHFYDWGLGDRNEYDHNLKWKIRSLSSIYETLSTLHGRKVIDYLKIDVEKYEWIALPDIIRSGMLSKTRQLGIEIHLDTEFSLEQHLEYAKLLRSIEKMGMVRFDSEYNPWFVGSFTQFPLKGSLGYEIAWYNRNLFHNYTNL